MQPDCPSTSEIQELVALIEKANTVGGSAMTFTRDRLQACMAVGDKLAEWKQRIGHGKWEKWCDQHCPSLVKMTRCRWMKLAEMRRAGTLDTQTAAGMRQAYMLAGLLPDSRGQEKGGKGQGKPLVLLVHISRLVACLDKLPWDSMTASDVADVKQRLQPISKFIDKIESTLIVMAS